MRLEFIRRFNFSDDEIVTFTNLPVKPGSKQEWDEEWNAWGYRKTNSSLAVNPGEVNGVHLKLLPPLLVPNQNGPGQKSVCVIIGADLDFDPKGMRLSVIAATDDQGRDLRHTTDAPWSGHYSLEFPNVSDIKTLNLKLALHKSRFVEFTVKPERR